METCFDVGVDAPTWKRALQSLLTKNYTRYVNIAVKIFEDLFCGMHVMFRHGSQLKIYVAT